MPVGATLTVVHDATASIRASVRDVQFTLILSVALVITVVLILLRTIRVTIIAGVALPLSIIATFGIMWFCGFRSTVSRSWRSRSAPASSSTMPSS
jgi:multidrug efflux pump